jgi:hypothetical protein
MLCSIKKTVDVFALRYIYWTLQTTQVGDAWVRREEPGIVYFLIYFLITLPHQPQQRIPGHFFALLSYSVNHFEGTESDGWALQKINGLAGAREMPEMVEAVERDLCKLGYFVTVTPTPFNFGSVLHKILLLHSIRSCPDMKVRVGTFLSNGWINA